MILLIVHVVLSGGGEGDVAGRRQLTPGLFIMAVEGVLVLIEVSFLISLAPFCL